MMIDVVALGEVLIDGHNFSFYALLRKLPLRASIVHASKNTTNFDSGDYHYGNPHLG